MTGASIAAAAGEAGPPGLGEVLVEAGRARVGLGHLDRVRRGHLPRPAHRAAHDQRSAGPGLRSSGGRERPNARPILCWLQSAKTQRQGSRLAQRPAGPIATTERALPLLASSSEVQPPTELPATWTGLEAELVEHRAEQLRVADRRVGDAVGRRVRARRGRGGRRRAPRAARRVRRSPASSACRDPPVPWSRSSGSPLPVRSRTMPPTFDLHAALLLLDVLQRFLQLSKIVRIAWMPVDRAFRPHPPRRTGLPVARRAAGDRPREHGDGRSRGRGRRGRPALHPGRARALARRRGRAVGGPSGPPRRDLGAMTRAARRGQRAC